MKQVVVVAVGLLAVLYNPSTVRGADLDELKAAHEATIKAINARDAQAGPQGSTTGRSGSLPRIPSPRKATRARWWRQRRTSWPRARAGPSFR